MTGEDYEARKDEHRPDWPGYMSDHLPECLTPDPASPEILCICDRLRACEYRVIEDIDPMNRELRGYDAGLQAARDAVAGLPPELRSFGDVSIDRDDALAAIDALKEKP